MKNIFMAFSPYNVLFCYCIALTYHLQEDNVLFVAADCKESSKFVEAIKKNKHSPFSDVYSLKGGYGRKTRLSNWFAKRSNISIIRDFVKKFDIKTVYSPDDADGDGQAMFYFAKKKNKNTQGICIEDGVSVCGGTLINKKPFYKILLAKIFYGLWFKEVRIMGRPGLIK
jgi:hypothetical protein